MATRTIKTKIELDGEKEFKTAISNINGGLGVLNSEMKKTSAEYKNNANSVEALTKRGDILERTLLSQKEKVEKLKEALEHAKTEYGEADSRTMKWEKSLNNAEAAVFDTENAIKENNEALKQAQKDGEGLGTMLDSLTSKFGITLPEGIKTSLDGVGTFSTGAVVAVGAVAAAVTALVETYKKLIDITKESAASADNILTMSQVTGLDTDTIQELQYAAELIDVSFETIKSSMTRLKRSMNDAKKGNKELDETFKKLGVDYKDVATGELRDVEDVFYDMVNALGEQTNATERDADAMKILGKNAEELNPIIVQGTDTLKGYMEEAQAMGYVMGGDVLESLGSVDDAYQRLQNTQESVRNQIAAQMAPAVENFYSAWGEFMQEAGKALVESGIIDGLSDILRNLTDLIRPTNELSEDGVPKLSTAFQGLKAILDAIAVGLAAIQDAMNAIIHLYTFQFGKLFNDLGMGYAKGNANNTQKALMRQKGTYDQYAEYYGYNASGTDNWRGGFTWVGENGPELVSLPKGTQIANNQDSRNMGGDTYNIIIDAKNVKEFNDIIRIVKGNKVASRMRG